MPPRKSNASITATAAPTTTSSPNSPTTTAAPSTATAAAAAATADTSILTNPTEPKSPTSNKKPSSRSQQQDDLGIDDLLLPRSLTSRIARGVLPPNTSLQKDAVLALTKSATVFISFLASTANEQRPSAKTVTPQDVLKALQEMELEKVMGLGERGEDGEVVGGRLERELAVFEEVVRGKRKGYREKVKARESGVGVEDGEGQGEGDDGGEREAKRARREDGEEEEDGHGEERDEEDALLDAQLNGQIGGADVDDDEDDVGDDPEEDEDEQQDEDEMEETTVDAENDELEGRPPRNGSKGRSSILAPNGRAELGSDDDSD